LNVVGLAKKIRNVFTARIFGDDLKGIYDREEIKDKILEVVRETYREREKELTEPLMRELERMILLHTIDSRWKDHLYAMDSLKEGIGLRGYGQRDPLVEYKREAYQMFEDLTERIKEEVAELVFKVQVSIKPSIQKVQDKQNERVFKPAMVGVGGGNSITENVHSKRKNPPKGKAKFKVKVGRNDPCPCGSGKKYKYCCGRNK